MRSFRRPMHRAVARLAQDFDPPGVLPSICKSLAIENPAPLRKGLTGLRKLLPKDRQR